MPLFGVRNRIAGNRTLHFSHEKSANLVVRRNKNKTQSRQKKNHKINRDADDGVVVGRVARRFSIRLLYVHAVWEKNCFCLRTQRTTERSVHVQTQRQNRLWISLMAHGYSPIKLTRSLCTYMYATDEMPVVVCRIEWSVHTERQRTDAKPYTIEWDATSVRVVKPTHIHKRIDADARGVSTNEDKCMRSTINYVPQSSMNRNVWVSFIFFRTRSLARLGLVLSRCWLPASAWSLPSCHRIEFFTHRHGAFCSWALCFGYDGDMKDLRHSQLMACVCACVHVIQFNALGIDGWLIESISLMLSMLASNEFTTRPQCISLILFAACMSRPLRTGWLVCTRARVCIPCNRTSFWATHLIWSASIFQCVRIVNAMRV